MSSKFKMLLLTFIFLGQRIVESIIMDDLKRVQSTTTTQDPLLHSGLDGFLQMIQEFGTLRNQVEHQEETNRLLEEKVTRLEKFLQQVNKTAVAETNYLAQGDKIGGELATLMQTTTMIESEMTNVVSMATLLSMDMMKVQKSLDDVTDCHNTFTTKLENMTSLLALADQRAQQLRTGTELLNDTNTEFREALEKLNVETDHVVVTANRVNEMGCESGMLVFSSSQWPLKQSAHFSKPFNRIPTISYGVVGIDSRTTSYGLKFGLTISGVTSSGFQLQVESNSYNTLRKLDVQWMACLV